MNEFALSMVICFVPILAIPVVMEYFPMPLEEGARRM